MTKSCLDIFHPYVEGEVKDVQAEADSCYPGFGCESETCSVHSPGPVQSEEMLAFLLINPMHFDNGTVVPAAFHELTNTDLSISRIGKATKAELELTREALIQRGANRALPQSRDVDQACIFRAGDLRSKVLEGQRVFGIYDTGLEKQPNHASAVAIKFPGDGKAAKRSRMQLRQLAHEAITKKILSYAELQEMLV